MRSLRTSLALAALASLLMPLGCSENGGVGPGAVTTEAPAAPTELTATLISPTSISLTWQDRSGTEDAFRAERRVGEGAWSLLATLPANTNSYEDTGLTEKRMWTYRVSACLGTLCSAPSAEASATTPAYVPLGLDAPNSVVATATSSTTITLTWRDNSSAEEQFRVERKGGASTIWTARGVVPQNAVSYQDTGLTPSTTYTYRVSAYRQGIFGPPSPEASVTTPSEAPGPLVSSGSAYAFAGRDSARVTGTVTPSGLATNAWVQFGTSPIMSSFMTSPSQDVGQGTTPVALTQIIKPLIPSLGYYYRVVAENSAGRRYGAIVSF